MSGLPVQRSKAIVGEKPSRTPAEFTRTDIKKRETYEISTRAGRLGPDRTAVD
ncbi:MAG: hypothetical protein Ct9H300mP7_4180 [Verrucomicrobiota bacterium]|nr:MAG: hypothetical protein Ct9H300mP7_4180 [Verrucomicrobiota bacterium]